MRELKLESINELKKLMRIKSEMLTSELAFSQNRLNKLEAETSVLRASIVSEVTVDALKAGSLWQQWRQNELLKINAKKAAMIVEHEQIKKMASRASAEKETISQLSEINNMNSKTRLRRHAELSLSLHFLANNIGDQDI